MGVHIPDDPTVGRNTERLNELAFGFKKTQVLVAALEFGIFTAIAEGAGTAAAIAQKTGIDLETADRLLIACKALDLVREVEGRYRNFADVERYLVRGNRTYFGDHLRFTVSTEYGEWQNFWANLRDVSSESLPSKLYEGDLMDAERARQFTTAGYNASLPLAHRLAKRFDFSRFRCWLDFAGGSGCYAIAACERNPALKAIVMDHPNVVPVTREFITKHRLEDRIEARPGNFLVPEDYPPGCDLISFITPLHWYLRHDVITTLRYAYEALELGGTLLIVGYMLNDDKTGPLDPAFYHLHAIRDHHFTGHVPSGSEYADYLTEVGFKEVHYAWLLSHQLGQIHAVKPAER
jgi:hypothetical protein